MKHVLHHRDRTYRQKLSMIKELFLRDYSHDNKYFCIHRLYINLLRKDHDQNVEKYRMYYL